MIINLERVDLLEFYGPNNARLQQIKAAFPKLKIVSRGAKIKVAGSPQDIEAFKDKLELLTESLEKYGALSDKMVDQVLFPVAGESESFHGDEALLFGRNGLLVKAKTPNQRKLVKLSEENDILFSIGPAGTGKTYTAVALAVRALRNKQVKRIILTRPAVEAGENLGFLPGDLKEKIDPYLRPLYDALDDMIPIEKLNYYMQNRIIEVAPLAFMRGRTLDHAFIILDEAQNATRSQIKMFLTRIGPSAKCIITGDLTQVDLPPKVQSGLPDAVRILDNIPGIGVMFLDDSDVVRHPLVKKILKAYDSLNNQ